MVKQSAIHYKFNRRVKFFAWPLSEIIGLFVGHKMYCPNVFCLSIETHIILHAKVNITELRR